MNLKDLIKNRNIEEENIIKRETIKTIIVVNLLIQNKNNHKWVNIHNNFRFFREKDCDLYFENIKEKEVIIFKITTRKNKEKMKEIEEALDKMQIEFFNRKRVFVLDMDDFPENIFEIDKRIKQIL